MLLRRRTRRIIIYVFLYTCLLYLSGLMIMLNQLTADESQRDGLLFKEHGNESNAFQYAFLTTMTSPMTSKVTVTTKKVERHKRVTLSARHAQKAIKTESAQEAVLSNHTLRLWDKTHPFVFLHIGKNGGTSFDRVMPPIISQLHGRYVGKMHFDWSHIEQNFKNPDVVVLLRDPVSRSVSHFHFSRKKRIFKMNSSSIIEYLHNPQDMLESRDVWQDGQASVMWLTGTHIANWVRIKPQQIPEREIKLLDHETVLTLAAERLNQTLWFGFLDDQERSLEMLQAQLGYSKTIALPRQNVNPHPDITAEETQILESLMPMDLWLYDYAKILFEARWVKYKTGIYKDPPLPPFPKIPCKSTRFILACNRDSQIGPLYHVWEKDHDNTIQQMKLLPKENWI